MRVSADSLESSVEAQLGQSIASLYGGTLTEYVEQSITALRAASENGAELWYFVGPNYPSWEGVAAVQECEIVETWIIIQA